MRIGIHARLVSYINDRTPEWNQASSDWKKTHPICALCGHKKPNEAHDVLPYHKLTDAQKHDYAWLMWNFITLDYACHRQLGHCNDPNCMKFNPKIREIAKAVSKYAANCTL